VLTRSALLGVLLVLAGCAASPAPDDGDATPSASEPTATAAPGDGSDDASGGPSPTGSPIGVPANACRLLDAVTVARLAGGKDAVATPSTQGPFRSCAFRVTAESGAGGTVYLDVSDQRTAQLYEVATAGAQLSELPAIGTRASLSPATGKVYVLTSHAFFTLTLPTDLGALSTRDGLRSAAEELAGDVVTRIGP
jgi:hypothetical protein